MGVELDGNVHANAAQQRSDAQRTAWLNEENNYRMLRSWNGDVLQYIYSVLARILEALNESHVDLLLTNGND